jgi:hypothetical protein
MSAVIKLHVNFMFVYYKGSDYCSLNDFVCLKKAPLESCSFLTLITVSYLINNLQNVEVNLLC